MRKLLAPPITNTVRYEYSRSAAAQDRTPSGRWPDYRTKNIVAGKIYVSWFGPKEKNLSRKIVQSFEVPATPPPVSILDGDENAFTPVEGVNLGRLARIQPFSGVAISLLRLFDREDVDLKEVAHLVQSDPALAAETLAFVNSPLYALRERVTELPHAITVLGIDNTKSLATTLAMRSMLQSAPKPNVVRRIWRHSIATAAIATELAPTYAIEPGLANTAGVLHDIGRLGLLAQYGEQYAQMVLSLYENVDAILVAERELFALDHCDVGMYLGQVWQLPAVFQEVGAKHHQAKGQAGILGLIHVACAMADDMTFSAIAHRALLPVAERVAACVPEGLREQVITRWAGAEQRIRDKISVLDF